jgi:multicomponent Na+:H+ antiporter subunit D
MPFALPIDHAAAPLIALLAPLVAAALCMMTPSGRAAWGLATLAALISALCALDVAASVQREGAQLYALGGWPAPRGVMIRIDGLGAFALCLVACAAALALISCLGPLRRELDRRRQPAAMGLAALVVTGAIGLIAAGDLFTMFIFLQLSGLAAAALVGLGAEGDRRAAPGGYRVLLWNTVGAQLYGFGAGLMFLSTGSFDVEQAAGVLNAAEHARGAVAGVALMLTGLGIAAAIAPLHVGLVAAIGRGPSFAAPLLGVALASAGLMALARLTALLVGAAAPSISDGASIALLALGVAGVLIGSLQAAAASDLRRLAAYAIAAQAGCVAIGLATATLDGMVGALFHALNTALVAFVFLGAASYFEGGAPLKALDGLCARAPFLAGAITVAALSVVGAPLTVGFLSKWLLLQATLDSRLWGGAVAIVVSTMVAMVYVARLLERLYVRAPAPDAPGFARGAWTLAPAMAAAVIAAIAFGVQSDAPLSAARAAVDAMTWGPGTGARLNSGTSP